MQNPFRHRPQDDFGRRDDYGGDQGWEARDQRYDERPTWSEGDGGRTAEAYRDQGSGRYGQGDREFSGSRGMGYGQDRQSEYGRGMSTGWTGDRARPGGSYDQYGYGARSSGGGMGQGQSWGRGDAGSWSGGGQGGYGQGASTGSRPGMQGGSGWGSRSGQPDHGYAPGAQIWEGSGRDMGGQSHEHHDFEPDYLHWRQQQLSAFDNDYRSWRDERRQQFSSDFDTWRQNRPRTEAANPIVGDVSDGGTGDASGIKKR